MFEETPDGKTSNKKISGSGSHVCCVRGCQNPGTVALGITKADANTQWKCSFHAWGREREYELDWRDVLVNQKLNGGKSDG